MDLIISHVFPFTGQRVHRMEYPLVDLLPGYTPLPIPVPEVLLVFRIESDPAFAWVPEAAAVRPGTPAIKFETDATAVQKLYDLFHIDPRLRPDWLKPNSLGRFWAAKVPADAVLKLTATIDTERPAVAALTVLLADLRAARERQRSEPHSANAQDAQVAAARAFGGPFKTAFPPITLSAFGQRTPATSLASHPLDRVETLQLKPDLCRAPGFPGYVGIDLGNTSTTLAVMPEGKSGIDDILLFKLDAEYRRDPLTTAVRVTGLGAASATWLAGERAIRLTGAGGSLILGAKRLLADPDASPHRVWLSGGVQLMPKALPAELFVSSVIGEFHRSYRADADPDRRWHIHAGREENPALTSPGLAVTCPTTFTDREIAALRRAVSAGHHRAIGAANAPPPAASAIALVVDEASAAGMFFVYRDFILGPGFTRTLHALYPHGLNLLVYDCGGGTTDIALINVFAVFDESQDRVSRLQIDVIGRSGHRQFGGDDISKAVFRLVKAKLAHRVAAHLNKTAPRFVLPSEPERLPAALATGSTVIDELVPTGFDPTRPNLDTERTKAVAVLELWSHVEDLKHKLGDENGPAEAKLSYPKSGGRFAALIRESHRPAIAQIDTFLGDIVVTRAEVAALIRADVQLSVEKANRLIRRRIGARGEHDPEDEAPTARARAAGEVHQVYVLGNSSRYPLVREVIRESLEVRFLAAAVGEKAAGGDKPEKLDGRLVFPEDELKGAVAKGAVAALRLQHEVEGLEVTFDTELSRRLLFDLWFADYGDAPIRVYREGEPYTDLQPREIAPPLADAGATPASRGKTARLKRQWPDETVQENYLNFKFARPWIGPLLVQYVQEDGPAFKAAPPRGDVPAPYFTMTDLGTNETVCGEEEPQAAYVSPPQSGLL